MNWVNSRDFRGSWNDALDRGKVDLWFEDRDWVCGIYRGVLRYNKICVPARHLVLFQYWITDIQGWHHFSDVAATDHTIRLNHITQFTKDLSIKRLTEFWRKRKLHNLIFCLYLFNNVNSFSKYSTVWSWNHQSSDICKFAPSAQETRCCVEGKYRVPYWQGATLWVL